MKGIQKLIIALAVSFPTGLLAQTNMYVSTKGNDADKGTKARPFASINRALAEARKTPGKVVLNLLEGTYYLGQPIVFTPEDSRKENENLTITNFDNQKVVIIRGMNKYYK